MKYNYEASLDLDDLQFVLLEITGPKEISQRYNIPVATINSYRAKPTSSNYRDWRGISVKKAIEILAIHEIETLLNIYTPPAYKMYPDPEVGEVSNRFLAREIDFVVDVPDREIADFKQNIEKVTREERKQIARLWQIGVGRLKYTEYDSKEKEQALKEVDKLFIELADKYHFRKK